MLEHQATQEDYKSFPIIVYMQEKTTSIINATLIAAFQQQKQRYK